MYKFQKWSVARRIESLREMDQILSKMMVGSRDTIWHQWGGGLKATREETEANWKRIAENDELYADAVFCYMICTLEPITLGQNKKLNSLKNLKEKF